MSDQQFELTVRTLDDDDIRNFKNTYASRDFESPSTTGMVNDIRCLLATVDALNKDIEMLRRDLAESRKREHEYHLAADANGSATAHMSRALDAEERVAVRDGEIVFLKRFLAASEAEIASLRQCSTCCGTPHASGLPCVCGGTNRADEEVKGLRLAAMRAESEMQRQKNTLPMIPISARDSAIGTYETLVVHLYFRERQLRDKGEHGAASELKRMAEGCMAMSRDLKNDILGANFQPGSGGVL